MSEKEINEEVKEFTDLIKNLNIDNRREVMKVLQASLKLIEVMSADRLSKCTKLEERTLALTQILELVSKNSNPFVTGKVIEILRTNGI